MSALKRRAVLTFQSSFIAASAFSGLNTGAHDTYSPYVWAPASSSSNKRGHTESRSKADDVITSSGRLCVSHIPFRRHFRPSPKRSRMPHGKCKNHALRCRNRSDIPTGPDVTTSAQPGLSSGIVGAFIRCPASTKN